MSSNHQNSALLRLLVRTLLAPGGIDCGMMVSNVFVNKQRCVCKRQLLPQLVRPLLAQIGHLIPIWARGYPISREKLPDPRRNRPVRPVSVEHGWGFFIS